MKLFSQNLYVLRNAWNMTQLELAGKFGVTGPSYSRWENDTEPKYEMLVKIAQFFKISIDRLLKEELTPQTVPPKWGREETDAQEEHDLLMAEVLRQMAELRREQEEIRKRLPE